MSTKKTSRRTTKKSTDGAPGEAGAATTTPEDDSPGEWVQVEGGATIGGPGAEDGVMIKDEEHPAGARISLEKEGSNAPFIVTCGIYGWMFHTRYFDAEPDARGEYVAMRKGLTDILGMVPEPGSPDAEKKIENTQAAIAKFVEQYP
ncbi:MAG: hypothetical protein ACYCW6_04020 [Candidatus Xenobia bacterium]